MPASLLKSGHDCRHGIYSRDELATLARLGEGGVVRGNQLVPALKKYFAELNGTDSISDAALARELGQTQPNITQWQSQQTDLTPRQVVNLLRKYRQSVEAQLAKTCINPIVEFFEIDPTESRRGAKFEVFSTKDGTIEHPYRAGLKKALCERQGIYVFYDSRGRGLYAGKTNRQPLWNEINGAFNRERGRELQSIRIVRHPERKQKYERYDEKTRQITSVTMSLFDIATYFSAYEVHPLMIDNLESLIIRSFANDLLNKKMEHFGSKAKPS